MKSRAIRHVWVCAWAFVVAAPGAAFGQSPPPVELNGSVALQGLLVPGKEATDLRARATAELTVDPAPWLRLRLDAAADGLVADRLGSTNTAIVRVREGWVEWREDRFDLRVGYGRLAWGRLDEIMPSDVLNPIDSARYFLEGRAEARLPIAFGRARVFLSEATSLEGLVSLPGRRGRFDELDEPSSPFNLLNELVLPATTAGTRVRREEPEASWSNLQWGGRLSTTLGRVDVSVSGYRGFDNFGIVSFEPALLAPPSLTVVGELVERYHRFTMVAADAEAVVGPWAIRGEAAWFPARRQAGLTGVVEARALDAGVGVDRSAGDYRVFASVVWHRDWTVEGPSVVNDDLSLIGSVERRFSRDRYLIRVFGVGNPVDESGFVRALAAWSVRDDLSLDVSGGLLFGRQDATDTLSRFRERDFAFLRLRWLF